MKPIFKLEKEFLEKHLKIELPNNCWRSGSKIYLNLDEKKPILEFKVELGKLYIKKNRIKKIKDNLVIITSEGEMKNLTYEEEYLLREDEIESLVNESIEKTNEVLDRYPRYKLRPSISGGKDSLVLHDIVVNKVFKDRNITDYFIDMFNSTNEVADTYKHVKNDLKLDIKNIHTPSKGWYRWLCEDKNYFLPSVMVRNCCSTFKEGQLTKILDKNEKYILFLGMRKYESSKRSFYDFYLNDAYKKHGKDVNLPKGADWIRFLPIVNWKDEHIWLYILHNKLKYNPIYDKGFNRAGCLICPYSSDYNDMLIREFYPSFMERWEYALEKNYELYNVENRLKWSLDEWKLGKQKQGTSKEQELISKKPTPERITELSNLKGISEDLAAKYFKRVCSCCDKKLNSDEIAMFLKIYGRYDGIDDNRDFLCKKHLCEKLGWTSKEYKERVSNFRSSGCNLFQVLI